MDKIDSYFIICYSHNHCIMFYNILMQNKINCEVVATPCTLSKGCSKSIKLAKEDIDAAKDIIKNNNIIIREIYKKVLDKKFFHYERDTL